MATATAVPRPTRLTVLYPHAQWWFLLAMVITWVGFSHSYFGRLRTEPLLHHVHGALMGGWIALLVVQPMLYQRGKIRLHRTLGRWAVYLWVPAMFVCGFLMDRRMVRTHNAPPTIIDQLAFLDVTSLLYFAALIVISVLYARNIQVHARAIVCTVLLLMPPALARILFFVPFRPAVNLAEAATLAVLLLLILLDRRRGRVWQPYPAALLVFAVTAVAANYVGQWGWWKETSRLLFGA